MASEDLKAARLSASFATRDMSRVIFGGEKQLQRREALMAIAQQEPLFDQTERVFMSRTDRFFNGIKISRRLVELKRQHNLSEEEFLQLRSFAGENLATVIHDNVFMPALRTQASDEQLAKWLPLAENYAIIGCYAQTELAHGSNVRGLQTTATYDRSKDEFDIHTPSVEATKWWIGALGVLATHAVVWARLLVDGKDYGVQPFMVQIRDTETMQTLPNIIAGDIGPKFGFAATDNGFMQLNHARVPRDALLNRNTRVLSGGKVEVRERALGYAGMLTVRAGMVRDAAENLARAVTIAVRYGAVRRQGNEYNGKETIILDYIVQQHRVLPHLAAVYALQFTGQWFGMLFKQLQSLMASGDTTILADVHAATAGLKSLCSNLTADGMEAVRRSCGGHGYSQLSGLPDLASSYTHIVTAEGENYLMTQQTTKYIVKQLDALRNGKHAQLSEQTRYLNRSETAILTERLMAEKPADLLNPAVQLQAYEYLGALHATRIYNKLQQERARLDKSDTDPFQAVLMDAYNTSNAHCRLILVRNFVAAVEQARTATAQLYPALKRLLDLFALHGLMHSSGDLLEHSFINALQASWIRQQVDDLLRAVRPDAVALVDAWSFPDCTLGSAIGRSDGRVYEALLEWAKKEPLNQPSLQARKAEAIVPILRTGKAALASKL